MSQVFFFTDIHGSWLLFEKVLDYIYTHDTHPVLFLAEMLVIEVKKDIKLCKPF